MTLSKVFQHGIITFWKHFPGIKAMCYNLQAIKQLIMVVCMWMCLAFFNYNFHLYHEGIWSESKDLSLFCFKKQWHFQSVMEEVVVNVHLWICLSETQWTQLFPSLGCDLDKNNAMMSVKNKHAHTSTNLSLGFPWALFNRILLLCFIRNPGKMNSIREQKTCITGLLGYIDKHLELWNIDSL